ncbi:unnamed protein product, partial [Ectocarpus fasciculatus]
MTITQYSRGVPQNLPRPVPHSFPPYRKCTPAQLPVTCALRSRFTRFCVGLFSLAGGGSPIGRSKEQNEETGYFAVSQRKMPVLFSFLSAGGAGVATGSRSGGFPPRTGRAFLPAAFLP